MTEEEAKTKICCGPPVAVAYWQLLTQIQAARSQSLAINQVSATNMCAASKCMAWRQDAASGGGYCGLAGQP